MPNVLVYNFKAYDIQKGAVVHANRMGIGPASGLWAAPR